MNVRILAAASTALFIFAVPALAQTAAYAIDTAHSQVEFGIRHMAISTVHGRFALKSGIINFDEKDLTKSSVTAEIDVASVDTGTPQRDGHLKSADFFDVTKYPTAIFKSESIKRTNDGYDLVGELSLHGVTKPVTLHMDQPSKAQPGQDNKVHRGFSASTTLHRQDFGLVWNGTLKSGDNVLGDDVKMTFDVDAAQQ